VTVACEAKASSGQEAIEMCDVMQFDFVLMDISMPQMDGIEVAKLIKQSHPSTLIAGWTCEPEFIPKLDKEIFALVIHKVLQASEMKKIVNDLLEIAGVVK